MGAPAALGGGGVGESRSMPNSPLMKRPPNKAGSMTKRRKSGFELDADMPSAPSPLRLPASSAQRASALRALADWLRGLETRDGNWPSSLPDARSKRVHFSHGAPGAVFAMAEAYRVYGDESFRDACLRGAETVRTYGLL